MKVGHERVSVAMKSLARMLLVAIAVTSLLASAPARAEQRPGDLLGNVVRVLERSYFDRTFREQSLQPLARRAMQSARSSRTFEEEREVIHDFLSNIPTSHLALISRQGYEGLMAELDNRERPTFGFGMVNLEGAYFVSSLLEDGAAAKAGLRRGDRVIRVDGVPIAESERLDWRTDDAALPDPPKHSLRCSRGDSVELVVEREPGRFGRLEIRAERDSAFRAATRSVREIERRGKKVGYVHFWYMHHHGLGKLLRGLIEDRFSDCDALVLDLRGRGGSTWAVTSVLAVLDWAEREWGRPVVALIDRGTRSAKEILAYELRRQRLATLVGDRTPGAVIPATFRDVGFGAVLMFPSFSLGSYTDRLEGQGVAPDIRVPDRLPYANGRDPILEAGLDYLTAPRRRSI